MSRLLTRAPPMDHTFRATNRFTPLGLFPNDRVTISDEHPDYFLIERRTPASYGLILGGLLGGELEPDTPVTTAAATEELVRMVAGLPCPIPLSARPPLRLVE